MTTSNSPIRVLKAQADNIARIVKAAVEISAARNRDSVKFGIVMDDKVIKVDMPWATIREMSEVGISEYILKYMRDNI